MEEESHPLTPGKHQVSSEEPGAYHCKATMAQREREDGSCPELWTRQTQRSAQSLSLQPDFKQALFSQICSLNSCFPFTALQEQLPKAVDFLD